MINVHSGHCVVPKFGGIGVNPVITGRTEPGCNTMFIIVFLLLIFKELIMFYEFGKNAPEATRFASTCRAAGAKSARLFLNEWNGKKTIQVVCSKAEENICSQLWDAYVAAMVTGNSERNTPVIKQTKAKVA